MNKIKTLYDVVQTLKSQETFEGLMKVNVEKDDAVIVSAENEFVKNLSEGTMKGKFKSEVNHEGCKMKHESEYDFDRKSCGHGHGHKHGMGHGFSHGMGRRHKMMKMHGMEEGNGFEGIHHHGRSSMKGKLNRISMGLDLLNRLTIEAGDSDSKVLTLKLTFADLPEEMKAHMQHKMMCKAGHGAHGDHLKDMKELSDLNVDITGVIGQDNNIKSLDLTVNGVYIDNDDASHTVKAKGNIVLK